MSELINEGISLDLDDETFKISEKELKIGNKSIGAYYTPNPITKYMGEHSIFPYILDRVNEKFKKNYKN